MAANTLSVYIKGDFYDEVKAAQAENKINVNEVCTRALQEALHPTETGSQPSSMMPGLSAEDMLAAAQALDAQEQINYEITYSGSPQEAGSFMQLITEDPASWIISMAVDPSGRYVFLIGSNGL